MKTTEIKDKDSTLFEEAETDITQHACSYRKAVVTVSNLLSRNIGTASSVQCFTGTKRTVLTSLGQWLGKLVVLIITSAYPKPRSKPCAAYLATFQVHNG